MEVLDKEIKSYEHATFLYRFKPHENFDLRDFGFQLNVNYIDTHEAPFRHTPFNGTVQYVPFLLSGHVSLYYCHNFLFSIVDSEEAFDSRTLFAYITTLAVAVLGVLVYKQKSVRPQVSRARQVLLASCLFVVLSDLQQEERQGRRARHNHCHRR
jgi:hypothetical protein